MYGRLVALLCVLRQMAALPAERPEAQMAVTASELLMPSGAL